MDGPETSSDRAAHGLSLRKILPSARFHNAPDLTVKSCSGLWSDCQPDDLFIALVGAENDGHDDVNRALARGARAILTERLLPVPAPQCVVDDSRIAYGQISHALAGHPVRRINAMAIAGSDGKSTTAHLIQDVFAAAGRGGKVGETPPGSPRQPGAGPAPNPAWTAPSLATWLASQVLAGEQTALVEVGERDLREHTLAGCPFSTAVLTNIRSRFSREQATYLRILEHLSATGTVVANADDPVSGAMLEKIDRPLLTVGIREQANVQGKILESFAGEQTFMISAGHESVVVRVAVPGAAYVYNCLQAAATGLLHDIDLATIARALERCQPLPGRMEAIRCGQDFSVLVDQADTPWRLGAALNMLSHHVTGRIFCVFSPDERATPQLAREFGRTAECGCHVPVITRCRLGETIDYERGHQVLDGFRRPARAHYIPDRMTAIEWALSQAGAGDAVLVAGCGGRPICSLGDDRWQLRDSDVCKAWLWGDGSVRQTVIPPFVNPRIFKIDDYRAC
jgi:UDP-N-acetylmuramoyl-L-alanyl-D-glutamate--2,6-diaminopimelate ligase